MTFEMTWPVTVLVDAWPNNALLLILLFSPRTPASLSLRNILSVHPHIHDPRCLSSRLSVCWFFRPHRFNERNGSGQKVAGLSLRKKTVLWIFIFQSRRRPFHIFVVVCLLSIGLSNVQKSMMHVQRCCFANLNRLLFCRSRFRLVVVS